MLLQPLSDFIDNNSPISDSPITYWYEGYCPQKGSLQRLPRTSMAEAVAYGLMKYLANDKRYSREGKMYGVLIVEVLSGEECGKQKVIKAFSGLLNSSARVDDWAPQISGRDEVAYDEARTLVDLEGMKQEIIKLQQITQRQEYQKLSCEFEVQLQEMSDRHQNNKLQRQRQRQIFSETLTGIDLTEALEEMNEQSRRDGMEKRRLKSDRHSMMRPLQQLIETADNRIRELKQQRKELSRKLQTQMHQAYSLMNFLGQSQSLQQLIPQGLPTGTGDCCAIKLLNYAAIHNLKPIAMAEFWWGDKIPDKQDKIPDKQDKIPDKQDKIQGKFYGACLERCQPLMGFLLSGLKSFSPTDNINSLSIINNQQKELEYFGKEAIIYQDQWLIAVNKPSGLLSVNGRYSHTQDSVLSRLPYLLSDNISYNISQHPPLYPVHRLDQDTSGILLIARDLETYRQLSKQFQEREIHKIYEAILSGALDINIHEGIIELPLWGNPENRPYQQVNWEYGKPSITKFKVISTKANNTHIEFIPLTGRTHQLRVHAADYRGLGLPILGDKLYGSKIVNRLHLHAREIIFWHPKLDKNIHLHIPAKF
jgi:tRNA pseudouridine32 synthase / 23S rRNA pseudouridine746 synthase